MKKKSKKGTDASEARHERRRVCPFSCGLSVTRIFRSCKAIILSLLLCSAALHAQMGTGMGDYKSMQIEAGAFEGGFNPFYVESMTDGAFIVLTPGDPADPELPIRAKEMHFTWPEGATMATAIVMTGNVEIKHPKFTVRAQKADWDLDSGLLTFTGNPTIDGGGIEGMKGASFELNTKTNKLRILGGFRADRVNLQGGPTSDFTEADIKDWTGLVDAIKAELKSDASNPGKQLTNLMAPEEKALLQSMDTAIIVSKKGDLLKQLNKALPNPNLYSEAAWKGIALNENATALLAKEELTPVEQAQLNRLLLKAAYAKYMK